MFCQKCGSELPIAAKFCSNCGTKVRVAKEKVKKEKKRFLIIAGVLIAFVVAVCSFFIYMENRILFTLADPERFFGECDYNITYHNVPGKSEVMLRFESDTDSIEKVLEYVKTVNILNGRLVESKNTLSSEEKDRAVSWKFASDAYFWQDYSLGNFSDVVSLSYSEVYDTYEVRLYVCGYQNCEFIDINPNDRETVADNTSIPNDTENEEQPTQKPSNGPVVSTPSESPQLKPKATATPAPASKPKTTATPKPQAKATATPAPSKTQELVAEKIDIATAVQPPKNAFQDFASWAMGAVVSADAEQSDSSVQYLDYQASQATVDAYIEMLLQNGFTLVDDYFFQYQSDPFASWALNCDYVPDAGKVEMQYESSTTCHLCISTYEGDYTFEYSSDLTQYDLGLRKDGSVEKKSVKGPSAGAGLYRSADGVYTTTDGRLSASMNKATIIRDGKKSVCAAKSEIKNGREWLWVEDYYRNEAICFGVLQDYTMPGDLYQFQDLKREKYYNDGKDVYSYKWGDQPIFEMMVDEKFTGPLVTSKNKIEDVTVRVMHYEEGVEAVYYIYAKTSGTPSEIEVLCAVGLNVEEADNDAANAIVLSVGETHTLTYDAGVFGAKAEVYSWSISGGDGIYADGTGRSCKVIAMKKGTGKVTVTCRYTVEVADILTGFPTTEQRSKSKTWYFRVE